MEIGGTGTITTGGFIDNDYNTKLTFPQSISVFDEMRSSDATVATGLYNVKAPILSADYDVQPASDDPKDIEIAEFVKSVFGIDNPFSPHVRWNDFLRHILLMYDFGFMYFEKVYANVDGKTIYKKLAPRLPNSIIRFQLDNNDQGITQIATKDPFTKKEDMNTFQIPEKYLFHIAYQQEGDNKTGISILRPAYMHWYYKNNFYKIQATGMERHANGVPTAQVTENKAQTKEEKDETEETLRNLRANSQQYINAPYGIEFKFTSVEGTLPDINIPIDHHDQEISITLQSKFITTGRNYGSYSQSQSEVEFLYNSIKGNIDIILEKVNRDLVKEIVDLNYEGVKDYPKIIYGDIGTVNIADFSQAIERIVKSGVSISDLMTQNTIRRTLKLPEISKEEFEEMETNRIENEKKDSKDIDEEEIEDEKDAPNEEKMSVKLNQADIKKKEKNFVELITDNEEKIQANFAKVQADFDKTAINLKKYIKSQYKKAKTKDMAGVKVFQQDGNFEILMDIQKKVKEAYNKLRRKYNIDHAKKQADLAYSRGIKVQKLKGNTSWSSRGFIYNIKKIFDRAPINITEKINDHFGTFAVAAIALSQVDNIVDKAVNKNDLRLSYETYPRSAFKQAIFEDNPNAISWKMTVPKGLIDRFKIERPSGFTMENVFKIGTLSYWASKRDDENGNPLIFPIHPNSQDYYMPIDENELEDQESLSRDQRSKINKLSQLYENIELYIKKKDKKQLKNSITELHNFHKRGANRPPTTIEQKEAINNYVDILIV